MNKIIACNFCSEVVTRARVPTPATLPPPSCPHLLPLHTSSAPACERAPPFILSLCVPERAADGQQGGRRNGARGLRGGSRARADLQQNKTHKNNYINNKIIKACASRAAPLLHCRAPVLEEDSPTLWFLWFLLITAPAFSSGRRTGEQTLLGLQEDAGILNGGALKPDRPSVGEERRGRTFSPL